MTSSVQKGSPDPLQQDEARAVPWIQAEEAVTAINGNQKVAKVTESGRGMEVEVREWTTMTIGDRVGVVISPVTRSQRDTARTYTRRCRTGGVSGPRTLTYTPESHFRSPPLYPINPSISTGSPPNMPLPGAADWYRGEVGERPCRKPAVFGPGRCSSVTPAAPGRSPRGRSPCGKANDEDRRHRRPGWPRLMHSPLHSNQDARRAILRVALASAERNVR